MNLLDLGTFFDDGPRNLDQSTIPDLLWMELIGLEINGSRDIDVPRFHILMK